MAQKIARTLMNNIPLKLFSLLLGYTIWHIISAHQTVTRTVTIPVCFYNTTPESKITAPETLTITLQGKRSALYEPSINDLALHIDAATLNKQKTITPISSSQLFLPENVSLVHYVPSPLIIEKTIEQTAEIPNKDTIT